MIVMYLLVGLVLAALHMLRTMVYKGDITYWKPVIIYVAWPVVLLMKLIQWVRRLKGAETHNLG